MRKIVKMISKEKCDFYQLLIKQTELTCSAVEILHTYCSNDDSRLIDQIVKLEHEGDFVRKELIDGINATFITPISREDLYSLSRSIDDILDYTRSTAERIYDFDVAENTSIIKFIEELQTLAQALRESVISLGISHDAVTESAIAVKKVENRIERRYRRAVKRLFELDDIKEILKLREIYRHISNAADKGDEAADLLCHIVIKAV